MQLPATIDGLFHEGNPLTGEKGTPVSSAVLNAILMEVANVVLGVGLALDPANNSQLLAAFKSLATLPAAIPIACTSADVTTILPAANTSAAFQTRYVKADSTAFKAYFTDPTSDVSFVIDVQYQSILLIPIPSLNVWVMG